jgi:hypothetical protein
MVRESSSLHERRIQLRQHRAYRITKTMTPIKSNYALRSRGLPTMNPERSTHIRKASAKVVENEEIEAVQVQAVTKAVMEALQPVIVAQLSAVLEEQRASFIRLYEAQQAEFTSQLSVALEEQRKAFTAQIENLKAEITALITIQSSTPIYQRQ